MSHSWWQLAAGVTANAVEPRIAVIAVHGVANQAPGDSAEAIAALLLSRSEGEVRKKQCYEPFQARTIYVPLAPACAGAVTSDFVRATPIDGVDHSQNTKPKEPKGPKELGFWRKVTKRVIDFFSVSGFQESRTGYRATLQEAAQTGKGADAGLIYMRSLLGSYRGQAGRQSYKTLRLEGKRCDANGAAGPSVDIYELYWADLSQLGSGPVRAFSSLYQLVLHVSELGRRGLEDGFSEFGTDKRWKRLVKFQELAVRQLTVAIPLFNVVLLVTLLSAVMVRVAGGSGTDENVSETNGPLFWSAIIGAVFLAVAGAYQIAGRWRQSLREWWLIPIVSVFAGAAIGYLVVRLTGHPNLVLLAEGWIVALFGVDAVLKKYDRVRPGALGSGRMIMLVTVVLFAAALFVATRPDPHHREVEYAALWTLQILNLLLMIFWILVVLSAAYASLLGDSIVRSLSGDACARANAALRTSRLSLAISAGAMLGILVIVWSGLTAWGVAHVKAFDCMQATMFPPLSGLGWILAEPSTLSRWLGESTQCGTATFGTLSYFRAVLLMGVTSGLPLSLFLITLCLLLLVWMAMPSARYEGESPSMCTNAESEKAGIWLSRGLDATKVVARLWWAAVFVVLLVFGIGDFAARQGWELGIFRHSKNLALPILGGIGTLVAASAAALVYWFVKVGGSALDVVLDVDNYLRELPRDAPPRALIAERYASLLRYVTHDRGRTNRPYDSIIIVAHSLGALITCDLLRFFVSENASDRGDTALEPLGFGEKKQEGKPLIPIRLFTMGNPLRQLLNRFFPHQYRWVREKPDNAMPSVVSSPLDSLSSSPSADALGVESWTNAYRSGDYVGRGLWKDEWFKRTEGQKKEDGPYPQSIKVYDDGRRFEMCIGLGAHTHYWDETAPDIRDRLDLLIVESSKPASAPDPPSLASGRSAIP